MNPELPWRTSSWSAGGNCVAVAAAPDGVHVTNNSHPDSPVLGFTAAEWAAFVAGVKRGEFDFEEAR